MHTKWMSRKIALKRRINSAFVQQDNEFLKEEEADKKNCNRMLAFEQDVHFHL